MAPNAPPMCLSAGPSWKAPSRTGYPGSTPTVAERALAQKGAFLLTVPSAFTETTGKAHWHVLLRARAIENGAFVMAPAQGGAHANGRQTYGHSLIIAPWGEILAEAGTEPGVILADIDPAAVTNARSRVPSLRHDRDFEGT